MALPGVGSVGPARFGDAPSSPPWPKPKSLAAAPLAIFRQALMGRQIGSVSLPQFAGKFVKINLGDRHPAARRRIADKDSVRLDFFDVRIVID